MAVAENVGVRLDALVQRVYEVEGKLMSWNLEERRRALASEDEVLSDDD